MTTYSVCIPGNGTGQRFNNELPKQFVLIRDRPLIYHTISAFVTSARKLKEFKLDEIVVSCSAEFEDYILESVVAPLTEPDNLLRITLVRGGEVRHQSIFNCLKHLAGRHEVKGLSIRQCLLVWLPVRTHLHRLQNKTNFSFLPENGDHIVLVHDAVRPLVEADLVEKLIKNALAYGVIRMRFRFKDKEIFREATILFEILNLRELFFFFFSRPLVLFAICRPPF